LEVTIREYSKGQRRLQISCPPEPRRREGLTQSPWIALVACVKLRAICEVPWASRRLVVTRVASQNRKFTPHTRAPHWGPPRETRKLPNLLVVVRVIAPAEDRHGGPSSRIFHGNVDSRKGSSIRNSVRQNAILQRAFTNFLPPSCGAFCTKIRNRNINLVAGRRGNAAPAVANVRLRSFFRHQVVVLAVKIGSAIGCARNSASSPCFGCA